MPAGTSTHVVADGGDGGLAAEKRQATEERILRAGRRLLGERGLDLTMDEIAEEAGVARRTVFRHFATRESLLAAAIDSGMRRYGEQLPAYAGGEWRDWLHQTCRSVHRLNRSYGRGYWELTSRHDLQGELARAEERRRVARRSAMEGLAATAWRAAGGSETVPPAVVATVTVHLSAHFTAAAVHEAGLDWEGSAAMAEAAITTEIERSLGAEAG